jgi:endo-1,4-beta-xylanase
VVDSRLVSLVALAACGGLPPPVDEALTTPTPLRSYADSAGVRIGTAVSPDGFDHDDLYKQIIAHQFNTVVAEHFMGMDVLQAQQGNFDFVRTDAFLEFAADNHLAVRGPTLIYGKDNPRWLDDGSWTPQQLTQIIQDHVSTVLQHVHGKLFSYDVVNEALHENDDGTVSFEDNIYTRVLGHDSTYIRLALAEARSADPDVKLFINEFGAETPGPKFDAMYAMVSGFVHDGVPIDGVGYQLHIKVNAADDPAFLDGVRTTMQAYADLGLEVTVTELDVRIETPASDADLAKQAQLFGDLFDVCHAQPACTAFVMWGFTDRYSWIPKFFSGFGEALVLDNRFAFKPAYDELLTRLADL